MSELQAMNAMFELLREPKMNRFGPSTNCEYCGQVLDGGEICQDEECRRLRIEDEERSQPDCE